MINKPTLSDTVDNEFRQSIEQFLYEAAKIVEEVHSEPALINILENYLFRDNPYIFGRNERLKARMGYLARISRDYEDYMYPVFLPQSLSPEYPFRVALGQFFDERSNDNHTCILREGTLYQYMLYQRDFPLQPYLTRKPFISDNRISDRLHKFVEDNNAQVGRVLYSPLVGRWHRVYILMVEFAHEDFTENGMVHNAHDIIVSRIGFSLLSESLKVMKSDTMSGDGARAVFKIWEGKVETHAEVINHSYRVAQLAVTIAEDPLLGIPDNAIQLIALAGLAHDLGKIDCTSEMSRLAELDSHDIITIRDKKSSDIKYFVKEITDRKKEWDYCETVYAEHPINSAMKILNAIPIFKYPEEERWWLLPVICHHKYNEDDALSGFKIRVDKHNELITYLKSLGIEGCENVNDIIDYIRTNDNILWEKAIDIISMADDIDGDVSPSTYRPTAKIGPIGKISHIEQNVDQFPHYNKQVIVALSSARNSVKAIYSAPANLANI